MILIKKRDKKHEEMHNPLLFIKILLGIFLNAVQQNVRGNGTDRNWFYPYAFLFFLNEAVYLFERLRQQIEAIPLPFFGIQKLQQLRELLSVFISVASALLHETLMLIYRKQYCVCKNHSLMR